MLWETLVPANQLHVGSLLRQDDSARHVSITEGRKSFAPHTRYISPSFPYSNSAAVIWSPGITLLMHLHTINQRRL